MERKSSWQISEHSRPRGFQGIEDLAAYRSFYNPFLVTLESAQMYLENLVGSEGFELEPLCGRPSPQAKSRAQRGTAILVGPEGFEPPTKGL